MIEFVNVGFAYGQSPVLRRASLAVEPGAFHVVWGEAGAGKTTVIRLCSGALAPGEGSVAVLGAPVPAPRDRAAVAALRQRIGILEAEPRFLDHLDLRANIAAPLLAAGDDPAARCDDLDALLVWTGLAEKAEAAPAALTAAERRRAALARAVVRSPALILADEPCRGLEEAEAAGLGALILELNRLGTTVLMTTRAAAQVAWAAERAPVRVARLAAGRLEALA